MPVIATLITDIYSMLGKREGTDLVLDEWVHHGANMAQHIHKSISADERGPRKDGVLYATEIGKPCVRQVYYKINNPHDAVDVPPWTKFKFLYGTLIEESVIALAKAAGHKVDDEQREVSFRLPSGWEVRGRMDCSIDGHVVDVKSMAPFSYAAVKEYGFTDDTDKFGYRAQVDFYAKSTLNGKDPFLLCVDKVNGHMMLRDGELWLSRKEWLAGMIARTDALSSGKIPDRAFGDYIEGSKGNRRLGTQCSYCEYKHVCWPGLRGFAYAKGPVWLTEVKELPKVKEITYDAD